MPLPGPKSQEQGLEAGFAEQRSTLDGPSLQLQGAGLQLREPGWTPTWGMCQF